MLVGWVSLSMQLITNGAGKPESEIMLRLRSRASATLILGLAPLPVLPGQRNTPREVPTISSPDHRYLTPVPGPLHVIFRPGASLALGCALAPPLSRESAYLLSNTYMATQGISSLVDVMKRPHDIGHCSRFDAGDVPVVRWIEIVSGQCVYGDLGAVSWVFGTCSLLPSSLRMRCLTF